MIERFPIIFTF